MNTESIIQQNRDVYNSIADHFSDTRSFLWKDLDVLREYVSDGDPACRQARRILDIGCGNGRLYQLFTDISTSFVGVDISEKLIALAKKEYLDCEFVVGDMRSLPFDDVSFDVVFSLVAFHHMPDRASQLQSLKEMHRITKAGGKIVMLNWNANSDWVKQKIAKGDYENLGDQLFRVPWKTAEKELLGDRVYYGFTLEELQGLLEKSDLVLEDQYYLRHGERVGVEQGMNIVTICTK